MIGTMDRRWISRVTVSEGWRQEKTRNMQNPCGEGKGGTGWDERSRRAKADEATAVEVDAEKANVEKVAALSGVFERETAGDADNCATISDR